MAKAMTTEERLQALAEYDPKEHLIKIKGRDGMMKDYLPAAWRFYELSLRYPNANFSIDLELADQEKNFCVVRARLYLGASYEQSDKKAESMKQGQMSALDKAETAAKARCSRDFGIGTEYALEFSDEDVDEVGHSPTTTVLKNQPKNDERKETSTSLPQGVTTPRKSVTPLVQSQEPRKEKLATSEQMVEIDEKIDLLGVHQYRHLVSELYLDSEVQKWTEAQAFQFLTRCEQWNNSDEQRRWQSQPATAAQQADIKWFRKEYGDTAVVALKSRLPELKSVSSADFSAAQADILLRYLYVARATINLAKKVDADNRLAKSFKGITHPLDFYGPTDGDLEGYLKKLEEAQAKIAA